MLDLGLQLFVTASMLHLSSSILWPSPSIPSLSTTPINGHGPCQQEEKCFERDQATWYPPVPQPPPQTERCCEIVRRRVVGWFHAWMFCW
ncbi:hypothetical protein DFH08DRAFT_878752 [Mycena albidolilacea]|uniref:Secreted protein n=1 Tax=Mycena albidolilacea TaxID=1033008 RepID=A0AAD6ZRV3_9AGAR|nr:hypothetical protein DFH08DRAFT_878752 [Mycena albidolilacea]